MSAEDVIRSFCEAWERRDTDEIVSYFTEDCVYHNIPVDPVTGHDGVRGVLEMFVPPSKAITFEVLNIVASGDLVFTERVDRFEMDHGTVELPVAGVFELRDGKIAAWRDYFDLQTFMGQMPT